MTYLSTGSWWGDVVDKAIAEAKGPFADQLAEAKQIADALRRQSLPPTIPYRLALSMVDDAMEATNQLLNEGVRQFKDITNVYVVGQISNAVNDTQKAVDDYLLPLLSELRAHKNQPVPSAKFKTGIPRIMDSVIRSYQTLNLLADAKPFLIKHMPRTLALFGAIGGAWVKTAEVVNEIIIDPTLAALDRARQIGEVIKWATLGSGLFMFYWYVLKPKKR